MWTITTFDVDGRYEGTSGFVRSFGNPDLNVLESNVVAQTLSLPCCERFIHAFFPQLRVCRSASWSTDCPRFGHRIPSSCLGSARTGIRPSDRLMERRCNGSLWVGLVFAVQFWDSVGCDVGMHQLFYRLLGCDVFLVVVQNDCDSFGNRDHVYQVGIH